MPLACRVIRGGRRGSRVRRASRDHDVEADPVGAQPTPRMLAGREASSGEKVGKQGSVGKVGWRHGEVGVGGVLGHAEVGVAGVEVNGLRAHQDERVAVRVERLGGVEQCGAGSDIEGVSHATHSRSWSSRLGAHCPPMVRGPVR